MKCLPWFARVYSKAFSAVFNISRARLLQVRERSYSKNLQHKCSGARMRGMPPTGAPKSPGQHLGRRRHRSRIERNASSALGATHQAYLQLIFLPGTTRETR